VLICEDVSRQKQYWNMHCAKASKTPYGHYCSLLTVSYIVIASYRIGSNAYLFICYLISIRDKDTENSKNANWQLNLFS